MFITLIGVRSMDIALNPTMSVKIMQTEDAHGLRRIDGARRY